MQKPLAAIDSSGNIQKNSVGHYTRSEWENRFQSPLSVVDVRGDIPNDLYLEQNYLVELDEDDPEDTFYEFVLKSAVERWNLKLTGSDSIVVSSGTISETYTIQKIDADGNDLIVGTETITVKTSRGLLSSLTIDLVNGVGTFTLSSVLETVSVQMSIEYPDKPITYKTVNFIPA